MSAGPNSPTGDGGDIESVYGYSGPIASSAEPSFLFRAWRWFDDWCRDQHIVSEFIRFHPLLETRRFAHPSMTVDADRHTVLVPLDGSEDTLMRQAAPEHRNRLKKARSAGLRFVDVTAEPDGLARFDDLSRHHEARGSIGFLRFLGSPHVGANGRTGRSLACFLFKTMDGTSPGPCS